MKSDENIIMKLTKTCRNFILLLFKTLKFFQMDLITFITKSECECLNEADDHPLAQALTNDRGYLASYCDEQLIINISFNQVLYACISQ